MYGSGSGGGSGSGSGGGGGGGGGNEISGINACVSAQESTTVEYGTAKFWGEIVAIISLVGISGIVAGLTLGLMSLDETNLAILAVAGSEKQRACASRILPIRKNKHMLLTALVLTNTVVNETLPVVLNGIFGEGYIAVIASTLLLVIFSEIIPQAICTRHGLAVGALFAIPVRALMMLWYILAWPISKCLDLMLGEHESPIYRVQGKYIKLNELIRMHDSSLANAGSLSHRTATIIQGTLSLQTKTTGDLAIPLDNVFMLSHDTLLSKDVMLKIFESGYSRIPVYETQAASTGDSDIKALQNKFIIGCLNTKSLAMINPEDAVSLSDITLEPVLHVPTSYSATDLLAALRKSSGYLAVIYSPGITEPKVLTCKSQTVIFIDQEPSEKLDCPASPPRNTPSTLMSRVKNMVVGMKVSKNPQEASLPSEKAVQPSQQSRVSSMTTSMTLEISRNTSIQSTNAMVPNGTGSLLGILTLSDLFDYMTDSIDPSLKPNGPNEPASQAPQTIPIHLA
ncbi:hypothetical protein J3Q64DRAFT_1845145 [Phycomyces blakesleeanus]|uniref:CNNM transmembrane domain-containing protein n=1 Tax=Phycomyces blakesleeanus TaxID=4837 RepID=A0ABR3BGC5_PHYBL